MDRRIAAVLLAVLTAGFASAGHAAKPKETPPVWKEVSSSHFRVFYQRNSAAATEVLGAAERYYSRLRAELGFNAVVHKEHLSFWLAEKRCKIYLYGSAAEYSGATGAPAWSGGRLDYERRTISSHSNSDTFLTQVLPHEMAHLLFREYVGHRNPHVPVWLDEGVAQYAELDSRDGRIEWMSKVLAEKRHIPILVLNRMSPRDLDAEGARLFYAQAMSLVHFLISKYGNGRFLDFCGNLRDGYPIERALSFATGTSIDSLKVLEDRWAAFFELPGSGPVTAILQGPLSAPAPIPTPPAKKAPQDSPQVPDAGPVQAETYAGASTLGDAEAPDDTQGRFAEPSPGSESASGSPGRRKALPSGGERSSLTRPRSSIRTLVGVVAQEKPAMALRTGDAAPGFELKEFSSGKTISLDDYLGKKVVMLEFWALWSDICKQEMPRLVKEYNSYKDKGYQLLGITLGRGGKKDREKIKALADKHKITYPILLDTEFEVATKLYKLFGPLPLKVIIDCEGTIRYSYVGDYPDGVSEVPIVLDQLLAEPSCTAD